ncbi:kinesin-like protein KIN-14I, partial [Contarinia nasturtii]|uniref:kinesin-like protein KIN-14I n=1 Tax=Contarinia nasturtii TaxID=265458 RepID=UPI0012D4A97E
MNLDENPEDLLEVKSILTILGFKTKISVAGITSKNIEKLENDFTKIRSNKEVFLRYPALKTVEYFTPGVKAMILEVASRLKPVPSVLELEKMVKSKILRQAKKNCTRLNENNIIVDVTSTSIVCKILCPYCSHVQTLARTTGKNNFSVYNFNRHVTNHNKTDLISQLEASVATESDSGIADSSNAEIISDYSTQNVQQTVNSQNEALINEIQTLKALLDEKEEEFVTLRNANDKFQALDMKFAEINTQNQKLINELKVQLNEKDDKIAVLEKDLSIIRTEILTHNLDGIKIDEAQNGKMRKLENDLLEKDKLVSKLEKELNLFRSKKLSNASISAYLCCFETIDSSKGIIFDENSVQFNVCIFNHGTTGSGKSFTMFGARNENGLLSRSIGFILTSKRIHVSFVEIIGSHLYDITNGTKVRINRIEQQEKKVIVSRSEFNSLLSKMLKLRVQKPTNQNSTSSRSHLLVNVWLEDDNGLSKLAFVDLAGWESPDGK